MAQGKKILVAASAGNAESFRGHVAFLKSRGYAVSWVYDPAALLKQLLSKAADVVIIYCGPLDWEEKEKSALSALRDDGLIRGNHRSGFQVVKIARERGSRVPALFLVSSWDPPPVSRTVIASMVLPVGEELLELVQQAVALPEPG